MGFMQGISIFLVSLNRMIIATMKWRAASLNDDTCGTGTTLAAYTRNDRHHNTGHWNDHSTPGGRAIEHRLHFRPGPNISREENVGFFIQARGGMFMVGTAILRFRPGIKTVLRIPAIGYDQGFREG